MHRVESGSFWYDTGYTAAKYETIDRVLEIVDRTIDEDDKSPISWTAACKAIRRDVLALKEGK